MNVKPLAITLLLFGSSLGVANAATLKEAFRNPPDSARPGVYWYFMDGNLDRKEMVKDLESMKEVGLGNLVFLEVNVGVPRGPVDFMSDKWQDLFANAVHHAERLGIDITLGAGPGWTGSGGPWVKAEQSMQHLVFSTVETQGPGTFDGVLAVPGQRSTRWHTMRSPFYEDIVTYAFPSCDPVIDDINEKALYERDPYTSMAGVKPFLPAPADFPSLEQSDVIDPGTLIDLTDQVQANGRLTWAVPAGEWTIMRMGRRSTGASTRPAPAPGVGFDHDKLDKAALEDHFANYYGKLLKRVGPRAKHGWTTVHLDSWEMGAQNWTPRFRDEFTKRRGYDPRPYFVTFSGRAVTSVEVSERFLWDVRMTAQELVLENYAGHLKTLGHEHGFELSIEPYDMNPCADLDLGAVADVPMCEFWGAGYGYDSSFSCIESTSIAHTMGKSIVSAEAFTGRDQWRQYPGSMKNQGDWAFAMGINRFVYHTFAHKPLGDEHRPGMTMGPYGVHWDRGQTWWPMSGAYHEYVTRCSHLMRQGVTVSDILYLTPEGAPHVFRAPASALNGKGPLADKKGYGFDGCSPNILMDRAQVKAGRIAFPGGTSYRLLVLPRFETMTPRLLETIIHLVEAGAVVYGAPPSASPSLSDYPQCDDRVKALAARLWGKTPRAERTLGKGRIILDQGAQFEKKDKEQDEPLLPGKGTWIWLNEGNPAGSAPPGEVHFQTTFDVLDVKSLAKARIEATADNAFTLTINGKDVLSGDNFNIVYRADILSALCSGKNTIAVVANNASNEPNPAGFIAAMQLKRSDGSEKVLATDQTWHASTNGSNGSAAKPLGPGPMGPWHLKAPQGTQAPVLYPDYGTTAAVLEAMKVPQDFHADGPVRYGHRRTDASDIYFIANTTQEKMETTCTFRVPQGRPRLWNPVTTDMRTLPQYACQDKTTSVPIRFEPHQSFFVIFPRNGASTCAPVASRVNFPMAKPVGTIEGAWDVSFDPTWGGPETTGFDSLQDWTQHRERGIKYYSGMATYRKTFDVSQGFERRGAGSEKQTYLDLGTVHDMARVRLNGKDLGVVWCAPWRVNITDLVKATGNELEVDIANRWPNRLLGDQQSPDKDVRIVTWESGYLEGREYKTGRYTFTTNNAPGRLLPSGLLGPVRILEANPPSHSLPIDAHLLRQWSAPYRGWHYHPDHVVPAKPNIKGFENVTMTDVPTVFQVPGYKKWVMTFIGFDGQGYQSFVAESNDLVTWTHRRLAMGYGPEGSFDYGGVVLGAYLYDSYDIKAPRFLKKKDGKYYTLYGAYPRQGGYELRPGYEGVAFSDDGFVWQRAKDEPILSVHQSDCGLWEKDCIYQPWLVEHKGTYYDFYNAANGGIEQMGLALSKDLLEWKRYARNPVIPHGPKGSYNERFSSDGKVFWDRDHWVNFFFGVGRGGAHVMVAFSRDLTRWTVDPEPLYKAGGNPSGLDKQYAHKISLVWNATNQTYYMFYNAVGNKGRGIGLITSKPIVRVATKPQGLSER